VTACRGLKLSTGHIIPYNATIGFLHPHAPFSTPPPDLPASIPGLKQPPLGEFYPFRYSELRAREGEEGFHQFTQTGRDNINFGHGPGSCPGRWFASSEVKVIIIELLRRYDVALGPNGEGDGKEFNRPQATVLPGSLMNMPDPAAAIYFKERAEATKT